MDRRKDFFLREDIDNIEKLIAKGKKKVRDNSNPNITKIKYE